MVNILKKQSKSHVEKCDVRCCVSRLYALYLCLCGAIISLDGASRVALGGPRRLSQRGMGAVSGARRLRRRTTESKPTTDGRHTVEIVHGQGRDHVGHPRNGWVEKTHVVPPTSIGGRTVCDGTLEGVRAIRILLAIYGPVRNLPADAGQGAPASAVTRAKGQRRKGGRGSVSVSE